MPPTNTQQARPGFNTSVSDLEEMCQFLQEEAVTHVVMESTGSYWIPVFNVLEAHFTIVLANPEDVKNRKGIRPTVKTQSIWRIC